MYGGLQTRFCKKIQLQRYDKESIHGKYYYRVILFYIDIDECETKSNNCHPNAKCINNEGSFTCQCKPNYDGDGITNCQCK